MSIQGVGGPTTAQAGPQSDRIARRSPPKPPRGSPPSGAGAPPPQAPSPPPRGANGGPDAAQNALEFLANRYSGNAASTLSQQVQDGAAKLVTAVSDGLDAMSALWATNENVTSAVGELRSTFESSVQDSLDAYLGTQKQDSQALESDLRSAFASLADGLHEQLASSTNPDAPIASLSTAFNDLLGNVLGSVDARTTPADSSLSPENKAAYAKFMEIYNGLQDAGSAGDAPGAKPREFVA